MGSGISSESIREQERVVDIKYKQYKNNLPGYNELQIKGRLRQEYNNVYEKDAFVIDEVWYNKRNQSRY